MHLVRPVGDIFKHWMNCLSTVCFEAEDGEGFGEVPAASNRPSAHLQTKAIILMGPLGGPPPPPLMFLEPSLSSSTRLLHTLTPASCVDQGRPF